MNRIDFCYPNGCTGAFTTSYDDGTIHDRKLVSIFNKYGIKGTFNLNSGKFGESVEENKWNNYIDASEVATLYTGHEVASHTVTHPWLTGTNDAVMRSELWEDRRALEKLLGYPVTGFVLPFGDGRNDARVMGALRAAGFVYCRHTANIGHFEPPADFMDWGVTCHHNHGELEQLWEKFISLPRPRKLFYLWGHSYEFKDRDNWQLIENFAAKVAAATQIWKATNIEVYRYVKAFESLVWNTELDTVHNPSALTVWVKVNKVPQAIPAGSTLNVLTQATAK